MIPVRRYTDSSEVAKAGNEAYFHRISVLIHVFSSLGSDGSLKFLRLLEYRYRLERGVRVGMG